MTDELLANIRLFLKSAELVYKNKDYTSATILYFKSAFCIIDWILLKNSGKAPKDHTERFRMLEKEHTGLYTFLDKEFRIYRDTYTTTIDKETCERIIKDVKRIIEEYKVPV